MWPVSQAFLDALVMGYDVSTRVQITTDDGARVEAVTEAEAYGTGGTVAISGGSVTVDDSSQVRRTCDLEFADPGVYSLLTPTSLIYVETGVRLGAFVERVPVFVGHPTSPEIPSFHAGVKVSFDDRSRTIARARFVRPWNTPPGKLIVDEIRDMIQAVAPYDVYDWSAMRNRTAAATWDEDRWGAIEAMATSIGAETYFDAAGRGVTRRVPSGTSAPVWVLDVDHELASMEDAAVATDLDGCHNIVVVRSSGADVAPVAGYAAVATGPLRWPIYQAPRFMALPHVRTADQAVAAAVSALPRAVALAETITARGAVNPALEAGDVLTVQRPGIAPENRVLSQFTIPLTEAGGTSQYGMRPNYDVRLGYSVVAGAL